MYTVVVKIHSFLKLKHMAHVVISLVLNFNN
jgi:hypothetical protein